MYFETWIDFITMGKHGIYVWSAYGLAFIVIAWNIIIPVFQKKQFWLEQQRRKQRESIS